MSDLALDDALSLHAAFAERAAADGTPGTLTFTSWLALLVHVAVEVANPAGADAAAGAAPPRKPTAACVASFLSDRLLPRAKCEPAPRALRGLLNEPTVRARLGKERAALRTLFLQIATTPADAEDDDGGAAGDDGADADAAEADAEADADGDADGGEDGGGEASLLAVLGGGKQTPRPEAGGDGEAGGEAPSLSARLAALQEASAPAPAPVQDQNDRRRRDARRASWTRRPRVGARRGRAAVRDHRQCRGSRRAGASASRPSARSPLTCGAARRRADEARAPRLLRLPARGEPRWRRAPVALNARPADGAAAGRWPHVERKGWSRSPSRTSRSAACAWRSGSTLPSRTC